MEMPGNRSQDILKLSVFVNQWELGKTCRICLFFYVGFLRSRNLLDRILMGCHEFGIVLIRWLMRTGYQMNGSKGDAGDDKDGCNGSHLSHRAPERKQLGGLQGFCILTHLFFLLLFFFQLHLVFQLLPFCINRRHLHFFLRLGEIQRLSGLYQLLIEFIHFLIAQKFILLGFGILFGMLQEIEEHIPFLRIHLLRIYVR